MGAFDSFGRSLDAIFEKRSPWPIHLVSGGIYNVLLVRNTSGGVGPHRWNVNPQAADKSSDVLMLDQGVAQGLHINHI